MLRRRQFCTAVALAGAGSRASAQARPAFELVTKGEAAREREARPKDETEARTRSIPKPPAAGKPGLAIRVVSPVTQGTVAAPMRIELVFEAAPGVKVVPSTFRVLYGVLKIDLTERLRRFATIDERGVLVEKATVPDGSHRLLLTVADDQGNVAEQELRVRVGAAS